MGIFNAKGAKEFEEFKGLVEELEMGEARPYAPDAPAPFKQALRAQLMREHERQGLSTAEMGRLWRFAGTTVAVVLLMVAVGLFWATLSNRNTAVGPAADTVIVATRTAVPAITYGGDEKMPDITVARAEDMAVQVGAYLRLTGFALNQGRGSSTRINVLPDGTEIPFESKGNELRLSLTWQVLTPLPHDDFTLMFHLTDDRGDIVQAYNTHAAKRPQPWTSWQQGEEIADFYILPIGDELSAGHYTLRLSLYDSRTDAWLAVQTTDAGTDIIEGTAVQLADWQYHPDFSATFAESDVVGWSNSPANVSFGEDIRLAQYKIEERENGLELALHWQPTDWPESVQLFIHLLNENGALVWQTDAQLSRSAQDVILLQPELDGRYDIIIGLYNPATGQRLPVTADNERMVRDEGTAVWLTDWKFTNELTDRIWIITATQKARPSANSSVEIEVTVGYELTTDEEVFLKLHYAAPDWEMVTDGRIPIDGMGDWVPLHPDEDNITITFTGDPHEMAQIVGTDQPVLVVQLGYFVDGANGRELKILSSQTFTDYPFDLSSPDEIRYDR